MSCTIINPFDRRLRDDKLKCKFVFLYSAPLPQRENETAKPAEKNGAEDNILSEAAPECKAIYLI